MEKLKIKPIKKIKYIIENEKKKKKKHIIFLISN